MTENKRRWKMMNKDKKRWKMMEDDGRRGKKMKEYEGMSEPRLLPHSQECRIQRQPQKHPYSIHLIHLCRTSLVPWNITSHCDPVWVCVCVWKMLSVGPVMYQCTGHCWTLIASLDSPATTYFKHRTKHLFTSTATLKSHSNRHPGWQRRLTSVAPSRQKAANTAPATTRQVSN